jgi:hypothetical protein
MRTIEEIEQDIKKNDKLIKKVKPAERIRDFCKAAANLALQYVTIRTCYHCGCPVISGYCCINDKCPDSSDPSASDKRQEYSKLMDVHFELRDELKKTKELHSKLNLGEGI